jgi:hypothetical protein
VAEQPTPEKGFGSPGLILTWLLAALGIPTVVARLVDPAWLARHWILALLLGVALALLFWLAAMAGDLWRTRYKDQVIERIGISIDRRMSLFWQRYREHLLADLRYVDLRGLTGRFFDPDLSDVYVDVALRPRDPDQVRSSDLPDAEHATLPASGQRRKIGDFLGKPQPRVLAVLGAPGSGKTTLLRHTACVMSEARRVGRQGRTVPILLYLRDHVDKIVAEPQSAVPALVAEDLALYGLTDRTGWLEQRLRAGDCLVMLDGLDEVARLEDRQAVAEWIRMQVIRYPGNDFVVTSRPLGYQSAPVEGAFTVQTQPFTRAQVTRFVHRWCLAEERRSTGAHDEAIIRKAEAEADDLLTRLEAAPGLRALTVSPLLLTMIAIVHRHYGALPGSRAELYARICQVLLWSRQGAKKLKVEPRGDQKERLMHLLAFEMMRRKVRDISTTEASAILRPMLRRIAKNVSVQEVLYDVASSGLFIERENGVRAFAHQTFQEYLAAAHIKDKNLQEILIGAVSDEWWRETTLLYAAGADAGPIVEACLAANTLPALTLAFDCAEEAGELAPDLREALDGLLAEGLAPGANPERRKPVTGVTLTRHLRHVVETASGARICSQPITLGIYRFFIEDMAARGQCHVPDTPAETGSSSAEGSVAGLRGSDAAAFVHWVNEITGGRPAYRLPTHSELADLSVGDALAGPPGSPGRCFWVAPDRERDLPQLYPPEGAPTGTVARAKLGKQLEADFISAPLALGIMPLMVHGCVAARILDERHHVGISDAMTVTLECLRGLADVPESGQAQDPSRSAGATLAGLVEPVLDDVRKVLRNVDRELSDNRRDVHIEVGLIVTRRLARMVNYDLGLVHDLARVLEYGRPHGSGLDHSVDAVSKLQQGDLELASNLELVASLGFAANADLSLARDIDSESARYFPHTGARAERISGAERERGLERVVDSCLSRLVTPILGHTLSGALLCPPEEASSDLSGISAKCVSHAKRFAEIAAAGSVGYGMPPDLLLDTVHSAVTRMKALLCHDEHPRPGWARLVTNRFASLVEGVVLREQQVEAPIGLSLRIMALCLAAEADALGAPPLGGDFRQIAGVVTWLELRHSGAEPAPETVVLALN